MDFPGMYFRGMSTEEIETIETKGRSRRKQREREMADLMDQMIKYNEEKEITDLEDEMRKYDEEEKITNLADPMSKYSAGVKVVQRRRLMRTLHDMDKELSQSIAKLQDLKMKVFFAASNTMDKKISSMPLQLASRL